ATNIVPGPATATDESGQKLTFDLTTDNDALFSTLPRIDPDTGELTFTPADDAFGTAKVTVKLSDDGSDTAPSDNNSTKSFTVNPVADTPSVADATTDEDTQTASGLDITPNGVDGTSVTHFKITSIVGGTLYQHDGKTPISDGDFITVVEGGDGLRFTPDAD